MRQVQFPDNVRESSDIGDDSATGDVSGEGGGEENFLPPCQVFFKCFREVP